MNPTSNSKQQQKEQHSMQYAAKILGLGYDRKNNPHEVNFALRILEDASGAIQNYLLVPKGNSSTCEYSASSLEEAIENIERKLSLPFKATFLDISLGAAYKDKNSGTLVNLSKDMVHTVYQVDYHFCTYKNQYPHLRTFLPNRPLPGEFVKSIWVYTGYKIHVHIRYQENSELTSSNSSFEGGIGYKGISFDPSRDSLENSLKNKEIIDISLELKTLSDFALDTPMGPIRTLDELRAACQNIRTRYLEKVHTISSRNFYIDPKEGLELVTNATTLKSLVF